MSSELSSKPGLAAEQAEISPLNGLASVSNTELSAIKDDSSCCAETKESLVVQSETHALFQIFSDIHQQRMIDIDKNESFDLNRKNEEKLTILQSYVDQLQEQNFVLISTLSELEKEMHQRVKQMEKRLKSSAKTTMEAVINISDCEKEITRIVEERLCIESLFGNLAQHFSSIKMENTYLRDQNLNLKHDVQALLHVIHHARSSGHWEMDCITFCEVTPEQVFGPVQSLSKMQLTDFPKKEFYTSNNGGKIVSANISTPEVLSSTSSSPRIRHLCRSLVKDNPKVPMQHSIPTLLNPESTALHSTKNSFLPNCISLPDIGNIYSCVDVVRKSYSYQGIDCTEKMYVLDHPTRNVSSDIINKDKSASPTHKVNDKKYDYEFGVSRAQSEPHLFMFGDDIYVYRPCEHIKKASNIALHDDFHLNFPPCQSIDLKFPSEDSSLKVCDWDFISKNSKCPVSNHSYHKESIFVCIIENYIVCVVDFSSSSLSSDSEIQKKSSNGSYHDNSKQTFSRTPLTDNSKYKNNLDNCTLTHSIRKHNLHESLNTDLVSSAVQTEKASEFVSIGIQADVNWVGINFENGNENGDLGLDILQVKKTVQYLKENALKAENKAEAKGMLIEQLQNHLHSIVHERDLKDQAFLNLEKKLEQSRAKCSSFKKEMSALNTKLNNVYDQLQDLQMLNDNLALKVDIKEEKIEELLKEQKVLQEQKRALMTQLDAQGDNLECTKNELDSVKTQLQKCSLQMEQQSSIIRNLQEALVQSKRAFDAAYPSVFSSNPSLSTLGNDLRSSSKSSIVDI
ncbi:uncharacterized protein LOC129218733 [Uloborus diversus]|uniref:uncharacterized protein LOC129218733 n=1 Tax=Uloborus diversus TaxID=327109 RepID=UPI00240A644F|nr:uncharacterized protein LOC129218733 [Uloborus diversus]